MADTKQIERNRALQRELYGETLSELVSRISGSLGMSQAKLAQVVGVSPPMLSQLASAQRVKIGNPAVAERMRALDELAAQYEQQQLTPAALTSRLNEIRQLSGAMSRPVSSGEADPVRIVRSIQGVLRAVASADELSAAAQLLNKKYPGIAEVLSVYGTGRTDAALEHFARVRSLI